MPRPPKEGPSSSVTAPPPTHDTVIFTTTVYYSSSLFSVLFCWPGFFRLHLVDVALFSTRSTLCHLPNFLRSGRPVKKYRVKVALLRKKKLHTSKMSGRITLFVRKVTTHHRRPDVRRGWLVKQRLIHSPLWSISSILVFETFKWMQWLQVDFPLYNFVI